MNALARAGRFPVYPILFALWPVLAFYGENLRELDPHALPRPLLVMAILAVVLTLALWPLRRNAYNAALAASILLVGYFALWDFVVQRLLPGAWTVALSAMFAGALFLVALWTARTRRSPKNAAYALNIAALTVVLLAAWPLRSEFTNSTDRALPDDNDEIVSFDPAAHGPPPSVYFIVLDAYARHDDLQTYFDVDNTPFIRRMEELGFVHVANARTEYTSTPISLATCLSMDRFENLPGAWRKPLYNFRKRIYNNPVHASFKNAGYKLFTFSTGFGATEPYPEWGHILKPGFLDWTVNEFEAVFFDSTVFSTLSRALGFGGVGASWRHRVLYTLNNLHVPLALSNSGPVFVQAHVLSPHRPYVFDETGNHFESHYRFTLKDDANAAVDEERREYAAQVKGLNRHVEAAVKRILETAPTPPIIAIVSDHGPYVNLSSKEAREHNLCLLHFPGVEPNAIPQDLRLPNLFRLLFNLNFETALPLLPETPEPKKRIL